MKVSPQSLREGNEADETSPASFDDFGREGKVGVGV